MFKQQKITLVIALLLVALGIIGYVWFATSLNVWVKIVTSLVPLIGVALAGAGMRYAKTNDEKGNNR